ncbi:aldehyde dehydrogenase family protein [Roseateles koreensis]|uniref:aldehyde dehydrogenase (NAD(+)) n=1 Tax=Roseateles koreensis TaxID=2987526 RepID=A0ABT5KMU4_9BURK|nr:aldehyde dehydrogenase family protein [Roseateles koreensis]MDC8784243.1 aldehyde dehydrogenase family protein [Roseateles koreensis]
MHNEVTPLLSRALKDLLGAPRTGVDAEAESAALASLAGVCVDGQWSDGTGRALTVINPAIGMPLATVLGGESGAVDAAARAAAQASETWRRTPLAERADCLEKIARTVDAHRSALAELQMLNNGKPMAEAEIDVGDVVATFNYYASLCRSGAGLGTAPVALPDPAFQADVSFEPCGVVGLIVPWNFPMVTTAWKLAPALAAGCTVVLKPSDMTPLAEIALLRLIQQCGLPTGTVNMVCGGADVGVALTQHAGIAKISFTGSTAAGASIMRAAANRIQRVSLELGGKSAFIVLADADLDEAVSLAISGAFFNAGQMCSATSRILIEESVYAEFTRRFVERAAQLQTGDARDPATTLGPLISQAHWERVRGFVDLGKQAAELLLGGDDTPREGFFMNPVVFGDVPVSATIWREEIFGPVACLRSFSSDEEAARIANDSDYGLVATIATRDTARANVLSERLQVGTVWINTPQLIFPQTGWGGFKKSGIGRELGPWGLKAFQEIRHVVRSAA